MDRAQSLASEGSVWLAPHPDPLPEERENKNVSRMCSATAVLRERG